MIDKPKIIALCGRKESGKSTLGKVCEDYGYKPISFAYPLKTLLCHLLNCDIDYINAHKTDELSYVFTDGQIQFISEFTNIPVSYITSKLDNVTFPSIRYMMQFIGTEVIRAYDHNWHVNQIKAIINASDDLFYIDDVRFPNELEMVESLGGYSWYIVRPKLDNISNHLSERLLCWTDLNNVIINNGTKEQLITSWRSVLDNYGKQIDSQPNIIIFKNQQEKERYCIKPFTHGFNKLVAEGNEIRIRYDDYDIKVSNPLMIETLKKYLKDETPQR